MITKHEEDTYELTYDELKLANHLIETFKMKTKDNPIKSYSIVQGINNNMNLGFKFTDVRLRKIVNYYRVKSIIPIMSGSKGYYVSYDPEDIKTMILSLQQRANSIQNCVDGLSKFLNE